MRYIFMLLVFTGCGVHAAGQPSAIEVTAPQVGYRCFAIMDGDGKAVGGNCLKD